MFDKMLFQYTKFASIRYKPKFIALTFYKFMLYLSDLIKESEMLFIDQQCTLWRVNNISKKILIDYNIALHNKSLN